MKHLKYVTAVLLASILLLSGCTSAERKFLTALRKSSEAASFEQTGHISFELDFSGGDEYFQDSMYRAKEILENLTIDVFTEYEGDAKAGRGKTALSAESSLDPLKISGEMWLDMELAENKYDVVIRIPALARAALPKEYQKDYLYINYIGYLDTLTADFGGLSVSNYQTQYLEISGSRDELLELMMSIRSFSGNYAVSSKTEDGREKLTFKMNDKQLKSFIITFLKELRDNGEFRDKLLEIMKFNPGVSSAAVELFEYIPEIEEFFESNTLLGDRGLSYELILDENGYIAESELVANIRASGALLPFYYFDESEKSGACVDFTIALKTEYANINGGVAVALPKLTSSNSVDLVRLINEKRELAKAEAPYDFPYAWYNNAPPEGVGETPAELPLKGTFGDGAIDTAVSVTARELYYDSVYCMSLRQAAELFGGEIEWNEEYKAAIWTIDGRHMVIFTGIECDEDYDYRHYSMDFNEALGLDDPLVSVWGSVYGGLAYVPLMDVENFTGADFGYDGGAGVLLIR